ncbi:small integral membrane protein 12 isoform X2 [Phoca vitulina]|uniref:small integral membrane protein 12 isoform X2 n=1 Tax=Phoca vitulina TaxID=9720 RepID=UPI0013960F06|nr:small integral membrane protein 12 isoform X2 [Phoca vitulina]
MKNPEPHLGACPTLPGAPHSALSPLGPGTAVAGPTQDQGAWASPLSQLLGRGDGASPHHTCGCSHIPLSIPGKIKRQNCTRAGCSLQKEPPLPHVMWPVLWTVVRTYAPYVTFPVAFVVGAVGYHLEWFIRGKDPQPVEEEKSISERREDRKLDELLGKDHTQVVSLKDKLEFAPKAVLNRNRPEKN